MTVTGGNDVFSHGADFKTGVFFWEQKGKLVEKLATKS